MPVTLDEEIANLERELREVEAEMRERGIDPDVHRLALEMAAIEVTLSRRLWRARHESLRELATFCRRIRDLREQRRLLNFDPKRAKGMRRQRARRS